MPSTVSQNQLGTPPSWSEKRKRKIWTSTQFQNRFQSESFA